MVGGAQGRSPLGIPDFNHKVASSLDEAFQVAARISGKREV
jgi:hypothetical protein